jgi:MscS family membrane protein
VLRQQAFLLENWQWIGLLLLVFAAVILDRVARWLIGRLSARFLKERLEEKSLLSFERPVGLLVAALVFDALLPLLGESLEVRNVLALATGVVATVAGVWAAYRLVDVICDAIAKRAARTRNKFDDMLVPLLRRTLKIFVVVVGLVFLASRWTEDLWGIVAGLGIGSLALGFAARDSIENLFGTFTVLLDKPFQIGDWIIAGGIEGTVEQVGFRSTRIRTFYDSAITVPNRTFISTAVDNMGLRRYRRIKTLLGLTYDTPPEKIEAFCEGIRQIIRTHPYTRRDYYHVYLNGFGASSLDVLLYCFVRTPDWATELREKHRLFADILRLAERLEVSFAFPTQTLHMAKTEDLQHPDRPADDPSGARRGRREADELLEKSLAPFGGPGSVPPPVVTESRPVRDGGDE